MLRALQLLILMGIIGTPAHEPATPAPRTDAAPEPACRAYRTDFLTTPKDCADDSGQVRWCKPDWFGKGACDDPGALRVVADADTGQILWVWWGDADVVAVELSFNYWQHQGEGPADAAGSWVQRKPLRHDTPDCSQSGFTDVKRLARTATAVTCTKETVRIDAASEDRAVAIRFLKRPDRERTPALLVDNLRLTLIHARTPAPGEATD